MKPEKAKISDVAQMHKLINYFADRGEMLPRPLSEIYENIRDYYVIRKGKRPIACAALHIEWADLAEIKSAAVDKKISQQPGNAFTIADFTGDNHVGYVIFGYSDEINFSGILGGKGHRYQVGS